MGGRVRIQALLGAPVAVDAGDVARVGRDDLGEGERARGADTRTSAPSPFSTRRSPTSVTVSNVDSQAKRISPPGTIDCSGSHWRTVPLVEMVLTALRASTPPTPDTARSTRADSGFHGRARRHHEGYGEQDSHTVHGFPPLRLGSAQLEDRGAHSTYNSPATVWVPSAPRPQDDECAHPDVASGQIGDDSAVGDQHEWWPSVVRCHGLSDLHELTLSTGSASLSAPRGRLPGLRVPEGQARRRGTGSAGWTLPHRPRCRSCRNASPIRAALRPPVRVQIALRRAVVEPGGRRIERPGSISWAQDHDAAGCLQALPRPALPLRPDAAEAHSTIAVTHRMTAMASPPIVRPRRRREEPRP